MNREMGAVKFVKNNVGAQYLEPDIIFYQFISVAPSLHRPII